MLESMSPLAAAILASLFLSSSNVGSLAVTSAFSSSSKSTNIFCKASVSLLSSITWFDALVSSWLLPTTGALVGTSPLRPTTVMCM